MNRTNRITSTIVLACFLLNTAVSDLALGQPVNSVTSPDKLAPESIFGSNADITLKERAMIKGTIQADLIKMRMAGRPINGSTLMNAPKFTRKENTVFDPATMHFFVHDGKARSNSFYFRCVVKRDGRLRTYYAAFSFTPDKDGRFPIEVYTEEEWKKFDVDKILAEVGKGRKIEDAVTVAMDRYIEHEDSPLATAEEPSIDVFIRQQIEKGDFAEIRNRRTKAKLGWDKKFPDAKKPDIYWPENFLNETSSIFDEFLGLFGTNVKKALAGKNVVFIRTPESRFPPINENGQKIPALSHMSENALYVFVSDENFDTYSLRYGVMGKDARGKLLAYKAFVLPQDADGAISQMKISIHALILKEIGAGYDLPYKIESLLGAAELSNNILSAYRMYKQGATKGQILWRFPELAQLEGKPVNLGTNLRSRDYASGGMSDDSITEMKQLIDLMIESIGKVVNNNRHLYGDGRRDSHEIYGGANEELIVTLRDNLKNLTKVVQEVTSVQELQDTFKRFLETSGRFSGREYGDGAGTQHKDKDLDNIIDGTSKLLSERISALNQSQGVTAMPDSVSEAAAIPNNKFMPYLYDKLIISADTMQGIIKGMHTAMDAGLTDKPRSLKMLPAYVDVPTGKETGEYLAVDIGGSNLRVLGVKLEGGGKLSLIGQPEQVKLDEKYKTGSAEQLFDLIAETIGRYMRNNKIDPNRPIKLGFTWSFPIIQTDIAIGIHKEWTKGWKIDGVLGKGVGGLLKEALNRKNVKNVIVAAICNDTVGTLAAARYKNPDADVGIILGTGTNAAFPILLNEIREWLRPTELKRMIINSEWGNFDGVPRSEWDVRLDNASGIKGKQLLEKMVSGMYLGEVARLIIKDLIDRKILFGGRSSPAFDQKADDEGLVKTKQGNIKGFTSESLSIINNDRTQRLRFVDNLLAELGIVDSTEEDRGLIYQISNLISVRAARVAASAMAAVVTRIDPKVERKHLLAVDGSLYEKNTYFRNKLIEAIEEIFKDKAKNIKIELTKDGSGIGAAILAAMSNPAAEQSVSSAAAAGASPTKDFRHVSVRRPALVPPRKPESRRPSRLAIKAPADNTMRKPNGQIDVVAEMNRLIDLMIVSIDSKINNNIHLYGDGRKDSVEFYGGANEELIVALRDNLQNLAKVVQKVNSAQELQNTFKRFSETSGRVSGRGYGDGTGNQYKDKNLDNIIDETSKLLSERISALNQPQGGTASNGGASRYHALGGLATLDTTVPEGHDGSVGLLPTEVSHPFTDVSHPSQAARVGAVRTVTSAEQSYAKRKATLTDLAERRGFIPFLGYSAIGLYNTAHNTTYTIEQAAKDSVIQANILSWAIDNFKLNGVPHMMDLSIMPEAVYLANLSQGKASSGLALFEGYPKPQIGKTLSDLGIDWRSLKPVDITKSPRLNVSAEVITKLVEEFMFVDNVTIGYVTSPYTLTSYLMGSERACIAASGLGSKEEKEEFEALMKYSEEFARQYALHLIANGADVITMLDPLSTISLRPELFEKISVEPVNRLSEAIQKAGALSAYHPCRPMSVKAAQMLLPYIAKTKVDILSVDAIYRLPDVYDYLKEKRTDNAPILIGNLDTLHLLPSGKPEDVSAAVAKLHKDMEDRPFICGSSCDIESVTPENMQQASKKAGEFRKPASAEAREEQIARDMSIAIATVRQLLPHGANLTDNAIKAFIVNTNLYDERRFTYTRNGQQHVLPPTFCFHGIVFPEYNGDYKLRFIIITVYEKGISVTPIISETNNEKYILAKGGCRWYQVGTAGIVDMAEKFAGNESKHMDPLLSESVRLAELMEHKGPTWEAFTDGAKTTLLAAEGVKKEEFVRDMVASRILEGSLGKLYLLGPDTYMGYDEMGWIEDEKVAARAAFGMPPTDILIATSRDPKKFGTFPHEEWTVTSAGVVEMMRVALASQHLRDTFKLDTIESGKLSLAIMGTGDVGLGYLWYIYEKYPELLKNIKIRLIGNASGSIRCDSGIGMEKILYIVRMVREGQLDKDFDVKQLFSAELRYGKGRYQYIKDTKEAYFCGADIILPAARGEFISSEADIQKMKDAGTKLYVEGANASIASGLEQVFAKLGIALFDGAIANGGGIFTSKEEILHTLLEGELSMREHREARMYHIRGDIADIAIANAAWLIDQVASGKARSFFDAHREVTKEIIMEKARLLDNPYPQDTAELDRRVDRDIAKGIKRTEENERVLRIVHATELARERVMGKNIARETIVKNLSSPNSVECRAAAYWAGKLRIEEAVSRLLEILKAENETPPLRRLAAISLGYIGGRQVIDEIKKIKHGKNLPNEVDAGANWAVDQARATPYLAESDVEAEISAMADDAALAGQEVIKDSNWPYTFIVDYNLYKGDELEADIKGYTLADGRHIGAGDRFNLETVDTANANAIARRVGDIVGKGVSRDSIIVQISNTLTEADARSLKAALPGVRFINVDTRQMKYDSSLDNDERRNCRFDLYGMMLAARKITEEDFAAQNSVYRTLKFYIDTHSASQYSESIAMPYIEALVKSGNIEFIINHNLAYRPSGRWATPSYHIVTAALICA